MKKIKIMQIIPEFDLAGAEIMTENLLISLSKMGCEVYGVSLYNKKTAITERLENQNIQMFYLNKKKGMDLKIYVKLYKLFKKVKPHVIHTHRYILPYTTPIAMLARVPKRIHTVHSIAEKEVRRNRRKIHVFFYKHCKVVPVAISPSVKESILREYRFLPQNIPMIYNGIDLTKCIPKSDYNICNNEIKIIHIGRFVKAKNHLGLINSFRLIVNQFATAKLILIGIGEIKESIMQKVINLGLENNVIFLGQQSSVHEHLCRADIFILPSLWEGMPISLIEAMATGLPIVATNVGGIPDMIENNVDGLLVEKDEEQLTSALIRLISDKDLREKLGKNALLSSKKFSATYMALEYLKIYQSK